MAGKQGKDLALSMLRVLPRLSLANIRDNPEAKKSKVRYNQEEICNFSTFKNSHTLFHTTKFMQFNPTY